MIDIPQIIFDTSGEIFIGMDFPFVSQYLCQSGDTGAHRESAHIVLRIEREPPRVVEHVRTGTYNGHIALKYVDELR